MKKNNHLIINPLVYFKIEVYIENLYVLSYFDPLTFFEAICIYFGSIHL